MNKNTLRRRGKGICKHRRKHHGENKWSKRTKEGWEVDPKTRKSKKEGETRVRWFSECRKRVNELKRYFRSFAEDASGALVRKGREKLEQEKKT